MHNAPLLLTLRLLIAVLFLRAGAAKLTDLADFRLAVANYQIVPEPLVKPVAVAVPVVEVIAGGVLLVGVATSVAGWVLAALLAVFSAAIAINLLRGRSFDCGCGGTAPGTISWRHVGSNLLLAVAAALVALAPPHLPGSARLPVVLAAALCVVLVVLLRAAVRLSGQLRRARTLDNSNH